MKVGNYSSLALHAWEPQQQQGKKPQPSLFFLRLPSVPPHSLLLSVFCCGLRVFLGGGGGGFCLVRVFWFVWGFFLGGGCLGFFFCAYAWFLFLSNTQGTWKELHVMSGEQVCVCTCVLSVCVYACICMREVHLYFVFMG